MIRTIVGLAFAGIALTPFAEKGEAPATLILPGVDPIQTSSMVAESSAGYVATSPSGQSCKIVVDPIERGAASAHADAGCADVYPGLETVARWSPSDGNTVNLISETGAALLKLGASDGFAYEAVAPANAQVTFSEFGS